MHEKAQNRLNYESIWQNTDTVRKLSVQVSSPCETFYGARGRVHLWLYVNWVSSRFNMSTNCDWQNMYCQNSRYRTLTNYFKWFMEHIEKPI